jgi:hypothetical protein
MAAQTINHAMDTTIGTAAVILQGATNSTTSIQRYYYTRFVSPALSGISSITAQTWTYNFACNPATATANANFPAAGTNQPVRVVCYVWRPGTGKLGNILDGNSASTIDENATTSPISQSTTFTGALVSSVQNDDVICFEVWFEITATTAAAVTLRYAYDGTTVTLTKGSTVTDHASFIETPQNLTFASAGPVICTVTGKTIFNKTTTHA